MRRMSCLPLLKLGALLSLTLGSLVSSASAQDNTAASAEMKTVRIVTNHQDPQIGSDIYRYVVPKHLGFFKEEGLEIEYLYSPGSSAAVQLVIGGGADIAATNPGPVISAVVKGAAIKSILNLSPEFTGALGVLETSSIKSAADLKAGMTLGVSNLASGQVPNAQAMVRAQGLEPDVDIQFVAVGTGAQAATALTSGQVDGIFLWDLAYNVIEVQGIDLRIVRDVFPNARKILDGVQVTRNDFIESSPDLIAKVGRAQAKGTVWSIAHPDEALELFYQEYPDARPRGTEQQETDKQLFRKNVLVDKFIGRGNDKFGYFPDENVELTVNFLKESGQIEGELDYRAIYTNDFIEESNAFDISAVEAIPAP